MSLNNAAILSTSAASSFVGHSANPWTCRLRKFRPGVCSVRAIREVAPPSRHVICVQLFKVSQDLAESTHATRTLASRRLVYDTADRIKPCTKYGLDSGETDEECFIGVICPVVFECAREPVSLRFINDPGLERRGEDSRFAEYRSPMRSSASWRRSPSN